MANKPVSTRYSEFRHFAEWMRKGKSRIRRELLPPMAAWILMLAKRYERSAEGMEAKLVIATVPGIRESAQRMRFAVEHLRWLMDSLPVNFDFQDWSEAVREVCTLMGIEQGTGPIIDIGEDAFATLIPDEPDAHDESGSGTALQPSVGVGEERANADGGKVSGRPGNARKKGVGGQQGTRKHKRK